MVDRELPAGICDVLDAGCGTGSLGTLLHHRARSLVGVDLSQEMLTRAAQRGVYGQLHRAELTAFMAEHPAAFDLIVAADVLIYFGDVAPLLTAAATALRPGGWMAFSVEDLDSGDWRLMLHGRYCQSEPYIRRCLAAAGMEAVHLTRSILRSEKGQGVAGSIVLARRS